MHEIDLNEGCIGVAGVRLEDVDDLGFQNALHYVNMCCISFSSTRRIVFLNNNVLNYFMNQYLCCVRVGVSALLDYLSMCNVLELLPFLKYYNIFGRDCIKLTE